MSAERPLSELLWWMRSIAGKGPTEWARGFARSMLRNGKRADWRPTPKQDRLMRRLVSEHIAELNAADEEPQLIEANP